VVSVPDRFAALLEEDKLGGKTALDMFRSRAPRRIAFVASAFGRAERHGARRSTGKSPV
jgi:hypothetical protein